MSLHVQLVYIDRKNFYITCSGRFFRCVVLIKSLIWVGLDTTFYSNCNQSFKHLLINVKYLLP